MLVDGVAVTAGRIGLPQFDERARHRPTVFVEHTTAQDHALADRLAGMLLGQVMIGRPDQLVADQRPGAFRQGVRQQAEWLAGRATDRRLIRRAEGVWVVCRGPAVVTPDLRPRLPPP